MENEVKEPAPKYNYISPEEYLEMERLSDKKHEYYKGDVFLMAGASVQHNLICFNINSLAAAYINDKGFKLLGSDFRLHIPENTLFTYPDFSIICGDPAAATIYTDNLLKPVVIIEVLSKATKEYDRGTKFALYRQISSLMEYIMIDSTAVSVEQYTWQDDHKWILSEFKQLTDNFVISTIGLKLSLLNIYRDVMIEDD